MSTPTIDEELNFEGCLFDVTVYNYLSKHPNGGSLFVETVIHAPEGCGQVQLLLSDLNSVQIDEPLVSQHVQLPTEPTVVVVLTLDIPQDVDFEKDIAVQVNAGGQISSGVIAVSKSATDPEAILRINPPRKRDGK
jgi:hypothetical protein